MIDLKFLRCWAVREKVGEELKEWIRKVRVGLVTGVIVEEEKKRVKCRCEVKGGGGEIIPWIQDFQPYWFLLELRVPSDYWVVLEKGKVKHPFLLPNGVRILKFRNGTVVRVMGHKLVADYLGVKKEGGKYKLVEIERFAVDIPPYISTAEKLREFLALSGAPSDIVESAEHLDLVSSWPTIKNLSWVQKLEKLKARNNEEKIGDNEERKRIKEEEIKEETKEMKMKKKTEKEKEREEGEGKNKKKRKINQKDDMPPFKPGTPVEKILEFYQE